MLCKAKINKKFIIKYLQATQWINLKKNVYQEIEMNLNQKNLYAENHKQLTLNFYSKSTINKYDYLYTYLLFIYYLFLFKNYMLIDIYISTRDIEWNLNK